MENILAHVECPECGNREIIVDLDDWRAKLAEPGKEDDNILVDCQCTKCNLTFWSGTLRKHAK